MRATAGLLAVSMMTAVAGGAGELDLLPLGPPERAFDLAAVAEGSLYDTVAGGEVGLGAALDRMAAARVVLLGEDHTSLEQKLLQAEIVAGLIERSPNVVLALEFFEREQTPLLEAWGRGEIDEAELLRAAGWYDRGGYRFDYYRPVMEAARAGGARLLGMNVPREVVRTVNRGGLESLSAEQREAVGEIDVGGSPQHRYLVRRFFGESGATMPEEWLDNMYAAQVVWDTVMARSILEALPDDGLVVVVVGAGHVLYELGIPRQLERERALAGLEPLPVAVMAPVFAPPPPRDEDEVRGHPTDAMGHGMAAARPPAAFVRSLAHLVAGFAATGGVEPWPQLGIRLLDGHDEPVVASAWPGSFAAEMGLRHGDRILDVNGRVPEDLAAWRRALAEVEWGQRLDLRVARGEETLELAALLEPELVADEVEVAPGYSLRPVAAPDPTAATPVEAADEGAALAVLVARGDEPQRVEVRRGDRLVEVHDVDPQGFVVRSLYLEPRPDGAVEVRWRRGDGGVVQAADRLDRAGRPLSS